MVHGGDIYRNNVKYDFSVNVNPLGMPKEAEDAFISSAGFLNAYPDIKCEKLKRTLSENLSLDYSDILMGNGASELFLAIVHAIFPKKALMAAPSFYGYRRVCEAVDCGIMQFRANIGDEIRISKDFLDFITSDIDIIFLTNPNNPDGSLMEKDVLLTILKKAKDLDIPVVLDECFMELSDNPRNNTLLSNYAYREYDNLIVVRAFTKSYAIPGLRLGYLVCVNKVLLKKIEINLPEWNISTPAQDVGAACLLAKDYMGKSRELIKQERIKLTDCLSKIGYVYPSNANYLLVKTEVPLYEALLEKGILIRDCSNFNSLGKGYYRIAVRDEKSNRVLMEAIESL